MTMRPISMSDVAPALHSEIKLPKLGDDPVAVGDASFMNVFSRTVEEASAADRGAKAKTEALAAGTFDDLHGTMISVKEAEISMKLVGSVRNKLIDAFHELWRTSV